MKRRILLQGAGAAALVLYPIYSPLLSQPSTFRMHSPQPLTAMVGALLLDLALFTLAFTALGIWLQQGEGKRRWILWMLPGALMACLVEAIELHRRGYASLTVWIAIFLGMYALTLALHRWARRGEHMLLRASYASLLGLGAFCLVVILQLGAFATWRPFPNSTRQPSARGTGRSPHQRLVWIVFDELSYQQVFGHRLAALQLANFDALRASSTVFSNVQPDWPITAKAIPSMLLGRQVDAVNYTYGNHLQVGMGDQALQPFDAAGTPFAAAQAHGLTTGVVGWYNPYCSMLAPYLNECYWNFAEEMSDLPPALFIHQSFWENLIRPWPQYWIWFFRQHLAASPGVVHFLAASFPDGPERQTLRYRIQTYQDLLARSQAMLGESGPDFVLLHLPLPHPPGFYNRVTHSFDASGTRSYIDNLALADQTLGDLVGILQRSSQWRNTTVVVVGDHSWRVADWQGNPYYPWSTDDQAASHGVLDPRPMLMVHQAGQTQSATIAAPFPLQRVHDILDALIAGQPMPYAAR